MYSSKKRYTQCTMGSGAKLQNLGEFSRIFALKGCTSCSPNNFVGGATAVPALPVSTPTLLFSAAVWIVQVVLVVQWFGVALVIERSLVRLPAGALSSELGQLSLPSLRGR